MTFFGSIHCTSLMHCAICRQRVAGQAWRKSLMPVFGDIASHDFECPSGKPWIDDTTESRVDHIYSSAGDKVPCNDDVAIPQGYAEITSKIDASDGSGLWATLADELRLVEEFILLHSTYSGCWKRRQRQRLIDQYHVAITKMTGETSREQIGLPRHDAELNERGNDHGLQKREH